MSKIIITEEQYKRMTDKLFDEDVVVPDTRKEKIITESKVKEECEPEVEVVKTKVKVTKEIEEGDKEWEFKVIRDDEGFIESVKVKQIK